MSKAKVVLITGCSSGFGRLTAETLARKSYQVFATMRAPARSLCRSAGSGLWNGNSKPGDRTHGRQDREY